MTIKNPKTVVGKVINNISEKKSRNEMIKKPKLGLEKMPRSIYIHIPFCRDRCAYCGFTSVAYSPELSVSFVEQVVKEIDSKKEQLQSSHVTSVYIGGGTPSMLEAGQIAQIVNEIRKWCYIPNNIEFTIETNPDSITSSKLFVYQVLGINRIGIGMQSASDLVLRQVGRPHTNEEFLKSYKEVREAGFKNINIDFIVGLPMSQYVDIKKTVKQALKLKPEHISCYSFMCERDTPIYKNIVEGKTQMLDEASTVAELKVAHNKLRKSGYIRYEISNFAKRKHFESTHNKNYWRQGEYISFGPSAVSFIDKKRVKCTSDVLQYCNGKIKYETEEISENELRTEKIMLALRTNEGMPMSILSQSKKLFVEKLIENKLAMNKKGNLVLTEAGFMVSNAIIAKLI